MFVYVIIVVVLSVLLGIVLILTKSSSDTSTESPLLDGFIQQYSVEKMTTRNTSPSNIQMNLGDGKLTATDVIGGTVYADKVDLGSNNIH
jgi:hypothetical protein